MFRMFGRSRGPSIRMIQQHLLHRHHAPVVGKSNGRRVRNLKVQNMLRSGHCPREPQPRKADAYPILLVKLPTNLRRVWKDHVLPMLDGHPDGVNLGTVLGTSNGHDGHPRSTGRKNVTGAPRVVRCIRSWELPSSQ